MKKTIPTFALLLFTSFIFSQNYKTIQITKNDGTSVNVLGKLEYNKQNLFSGLSTKADENADPTIFDIDDLQRVVIDDVTYVKQSFKNQNFIFEEIVKGNLSLYKSKESYFLIKDELEVREIPTQSTIGSRKNLNYGIISVFINDCQAVQEYAYAKNNAITYTILEKIVKDYNNCSVSDEISIPVQAINDSKVTSDRIEFGVSVGYALLNANFDNFVNNTDKKIGTPTVGAKVLVHTSALNNGLFFNFTFDYFFGKEQQVTNKITNNTQFFSTVIGINYQYKSSNETFTPFIGVSGGLIFNSASNVVNDLPAYNLNYKANNLLAYNISLGTFINVLDQKIEASFIYHPKMTFDVDSSSIAGDIEQSYDVSGIQFKLTYCF